MFGAFSKIRKRGIEFHAENDTAGSDEAGFKASGLTLVPASLSVKLDSKSRKGRFVLSGPTSAMHLSHFISLFIFPAKEKAPKDRGCFIFSSNLVISYSIFVVVNPQAKIIFQ